MLHRRALLVAIALAAAGVADAGAKGEPPVCNGGEGSNVVRAGGVRDFGPNPCYDFELEQLRYEIVRQPAHGRVEHINRGPDFLRLRADANAPVGEDSFAFRSVESGLLGQASNLFEKPVKIVAATQNTAPSCAFGPYSASGGSRDVPLEVEVGEEVELYNRCIGDEEADPIGAPVIKGTHGGGSVDEHGIQEYRIDAGFDPGANGTHEVVTATTTDAPPAPAQAKTTVEKLFLRLIRADQDPVCPTQQVLVPEGVDQVPITVRCEDADAGDAMRMKVFLAPPSGTLEVADGDDGSDRSLATTYTFAPGSQGAWTQILAQDGRVVDGRFLADDSASALIMIERATPQTYVAKSVAPSALPSTPTLRARKLTFPVGPYPTAVDLKVAVRARGRVIGTRSLSLAAGAQKQLQVKLGAAGRRLVKRAGTLPAKVKVTATDRASGATSSASRAVKLRR